MGRHPQEGIGMHRFVRRALAGACLVALAAVVAPVNAADVSRQCLKAQRKVTKEENWTVRAEATMERDRKGRESCATPAICARYDARLREMDKRKQRHDARLGKFKADAARACASG
jgi:hypothetical protein